MRSGADLDAAVGEALGAARVVTRRVRHGVGLALQHLRPEVGDADGVVETALPPGHAAV